MNTIKSIDRGLWAAFTPWQKTKDHRIWEISKFMVLYNRNTVHVGHAWRNIMGKLLKKSSIFVLDQ